MFSEQNVIYWKVKSSWPHIHSLYIIILIPLWSRCEVRSRCTSLWEVELRQKSDHASRHQTGEKAFNYKISRGRERGKWFKRSHFISSLLEKASLIVPSEWAVSRQMHLDNSSIGSWRGVPSFTKYGAKPFHCRALYCFINGDIQIPIYLSRYPYE